MIYEVLSALRDELEEENRFYIDTNVVIDIHSLEPTARNKVIDFLTEYNNSFVLLNSVKEELERQHRKGNIISKVKSGVKSIDQGLKIEKFKKQLRSVLTKVKRSNADVESQTSYELKQNILDIEDKLKNVEKLIAKKKEEFNTEFLADDQQLKLTNIPSFLNDIALSDVVYDVSKKKILEQEFDQRVKDGYTTPGLEDFSKSDNRYGDWFIFREMVDLGRLLTGDSFFITSDLKSDWYNSDKADILQVHKEYYSNETSGNIYLIPFNLFMNFVILGDHSEVLETLYETDHGIYTKVYEELEDKLYFDVNDIYGEFFQDRNYIDCDYDITDISIASIEYVDLVNYSDIRDGINITINLDVTADMYYSMGLFFSSKEDPFTSTLETTETFNFNVEFEFKVTDNNYHLLLSEKLHKEDLDKIDFEYESTYIDINDKQSQDITSDSWNDE